MDMSWHLSDILPRVITDLSRPWFFYLFFLNFFLSLMENFHHHQSLKWQSWDLSGVRSSLALHGSDLQPTEELLVAAVFVVDLVVNVTLLVWIVSQHPDYCCWFPFRLEYHSIGNYCFSVRVSFLLPPSSRVLFRNTSVSWEFGWFWCLLQFLIASPSFFL